MVGTGLLEIPRLVVPLPVQPLLSVTVTVYTPLLAKVAEKDAGFCTTEEKLAGPFQEKPVKVPDPPVAEEPSCAVAPVHNGPLLVTVTTGLALICTLVEAEAVQPFASVTVT
jgi:hypothetical protein